jgi:two-component system OmpR family response regulator
MKTQGMNLFIVDDNKLVVADLRNYLQDKFGVGLRISTFNDGESCLRKVNGETQVVILDYYMRGKNGLETLKSIKKINPNTHVIMLSQNADVALAIETLREGAKDFVIKGQDSWKRITKLVNHMITEPIRLIIREFGVSKYVAIFFFTFAILATTVVITLNLMK